MSYSRFTLRRFTRRWVIRRSFARRRNICLKNFRCELTAVAEARAAEVGSGGFEPPKSKDSGFTVRPIWPLWKLPDEKSQRRDSNPRPADYKSAALPAELL